MAFHFRHRPRLALDAHVFMHNTDAAFLRHRNRQPRLGNGVHGGGNQRQIELDMAGERGFEDNVARQHCRVSGYEQDVVKSVGFFDYTHDFMGGS